MGSKKKTSPEDAVLAAAEKAEQERVRNVQLESAAAIKNAAAYECKELDGQDAFVHCTVTVSLIELPKKKGDGPGAERAFVRVKTTDPVAPETAVKMLEEAASQYLWQRDNKE